MVYKYKVREVEDSNVFTSKFYPELFDTIEEAENFGRANCKKFELDRVQMYFIYTVCVKYVHGVLIDDIDKFSNDAKAIAKYIDFEMEQMWKSCNTDTIRPLSTMKLANVKDHFKIISKSYDYRITDPQVQSDIRKDLIKRAQKLLKNPNMYKQLSAGNTLVL